MQKIYRKAVKSLAVIVGACAASAHAVDLGSFNGTDVSIKGFLKMDAMMTDFSDGSLGAGDIGRDFYLPSKTPVGGESQGATTDFHARQSRFAIATKSNVSGDTLKTFIEVGFLASTEGNERVTNSYVPRMRHAFLEYNNWLFGQTWSTFMDVGALPETLDFIGNTDATIFVRQAQIRYTSGNFQFAVENPETTVAGVGATDDNALPDIVGRYNLKSGNLSMVFAGLLRQLEYNNGGAVDDSEMAYGISVSGVYKFSNNDDLKFMVNTGSGMGRYVGLNVSSGAALDNNNNLQAIDTGAVYVSYRHFWDPKLRSTLSVSSIAIDNPDGLAATQDTMSARLNLIYSPTPRLSLGGELAHASRTLEGGASGDMNRLQFSAKLTF